MPSKPLLPPPPEPMYPVLETLIERATPEELDQFFAEVRTGLEGVKGAKGEHARKARAALDAAQELLGYLLQIREKLSEAKSAGKARK
jgi:hypothetical protein